MAFVEREGVLTTSAGRRVGWLERGVAGGRPVGYLHGQPGSRRDVRLFGEDQLTRHGVRLFSIDRAGYGDTDPSGLDRREVAADLLEVADHLDVDRFMVLAVSMGGIYALAAATLARERVTRIVLISGHVLPYDDPDVEAALSEAERADLALLRNGPSEELDKAYADGAAGAADIEGALTLLKELAETMSGPERAVVGDPSWGRRVAESVAFGLSAGHRGLLDDGLRTIRPLEFSLADVRCPVRAVHGTIDDLEPYANLLRLERMLTDFAHLAIPGMGHFGPWVWPDLSFALLDGA